MSRALIAHPVPTDNPVRLAALVAEEAGEALKAALDLTRKPLTAGSKEEDLAVVQLETELRQTAAMALIALAVLNGRVE